MIYAVGDVHGEADALRKLLARLPVEPSDLVVFLGDLIDRGPDSFDCVQQVIDFDRCAKVYIQGNHEEALLSFLELGDMMALSGMDAQPTLDSYANAGYILEPGNPACLPESHARLIGMAETWTRPFHITDQYIFTHAGWDLARPLEQQSQERWRWGRVSGFENPIWTQTVVRGHTPFPKVTFATKKQQICVDTGCGRGGLLSAVGLPGGRILSARPRSFKPLWYKR